MNYEDVEKFLRTQCPECGGEGKIYGIYSVWSCQTCTKKSHLRCVGYRVSEEFVSSEIPSAVKSLNSLSTTFKEKTFYYYEPFFRVVFFDDRDKMRVYAWDRKESKWITHREFVELSERDKNVPSVIN